MALLKVLLLIPALFAVMGCSNDKKSTSRVGIGGLTYNNGICTQNGMQLPATSCQQNGVPVLVNGQCVIYQNGYAQPVAATQCQNYGQVGGACTTVGICNGTYQWYDNMVTGQLQSRYCNGQYNDCRGYQMICNGMQVYCQ